MSQIGRFDVTMSVHVLYANWVRKEELERWV